MDKVDRQGRSLGTEGGESKVVYEIADHPGWVAKLYKRSMLRLEAASLKALIELPGSISDSDLSRIDSCTAWPTARILEDGATVGVVMAEAPDRFFVEFKLRGNRVGKSQVLPIDWLIGDGANLVRQDIERPSVGLRQRIAGEFLAIGDLLERYNVVYGDWSYRNSLWSPSDGQVFLLDMDSCRRGERPWMESPEWEDPLYPFSMHKPLDCYNDRYKLAVLSVRCITGVRGDPIQALDRLPTRLQSSEFGRALRAALTAPSAQQRPSAGDLLAALRLAPAPHDYATSARSNVTGQRPVQRSASRTRRPGNKTGPPAGPQQTRIPTSPVGPPASPGGPTGAHGRPGSTYGSRAAGTQTVYLAARGKSGLAPTLTLITIMVVIAVIVIILVT